MDVDLLKSATEDQMEMMAMMQQMDKLSAEFLGPYSTATSTTPPSSLELSNASGSSIGFAPQPLLDNSPALFNPSISFTNNSIQESPMQLSMPSQKRNSMAAMRDMIFRIAAMQPIHIDPESVKPPKRRNVKISKDPQSVAARHRRERISEKIRILQRLVPGGTKMDTASMLDEAIHYVKFLKGQVQSLERAATSRPAGFGYPGMTVRNANQSSFSKGYNQAVQLQMFNNNNQMLS